MLIAPADQLTLARLVIAPLIAAAYLVLPTEHQLCFWVAGGLCGLAELTDWLDGRVARARAEVSDFGKLADPFCDVFYRITALLVLLLPAGMQGYPVPVGSESCVFWMPLIVHAAEGPGYGLLPFLPVLLMVLREIVAGALRSMAATKGLVLAARMSGKVKAWFQGTTIISALGLPAVTGGFADWQLVYASIAAWVCAVLSVGSMLEYIWVNRATLAKLAARRPLEAKS